MTDYLEALLDDLDDQEEASVLDPGHKIVVPAGSYVRGAHEREAENPPDQLGQRTGPIQVPGQVRRPGLSGQESLSHDRGKDGVPDQPAGPDLPPWLPETEPDGAAGQGLYEALAKARNAVRLVRQGQGGVTVTVPAASPAAPGLDLLTIDQAMERDARRYDGGFPLY